MNSLIDLHIHTTASDGSDTVAVLLEHLRQQGIRTFSVTDHDTMTGALEMEPLVPEGMRFVRGIEFSCITSQGKCHILGYGYDPRDPGLLEVLEAGRQLRQEKLELRQRYLAQQHGISLTREELDWLHSQQSPGKPHLAQLLIKRGMETDINAAIRKYLDGCKAGRDRIDADLAIRGILSAGGTPVWAHPLGGEGERRLTREQFTAQLETLIAMGIRGLECYYSRYSREDIDFLLAQAEENHLLVSGGSDYHGTNKTGISLGMLNESGIPVPQENLTVLGDG